MYQFDPKILNCKIYSKVWFIGRLRLWKARHKKLAILLFEIMVKQWGVGIEYSTSYIFYIHFWNEAAYYSLMAGEALSFWNQSFKAEWPGIIINDILLTLVYVIFQPSAQSVSQSLLNSTTPNLFDIVSPQSLLSS